MKSPMDELREWLYGFGNVGRVIIKRELFNQWYRLNVVHLQQLLEPKDRISISLLLAGKNMEVRSPDGRWIRFRISKI